MNSNITNYIGLFSFQPSHCLDFISEKIGVLSGLLHLYACHCGSVY